MLATGMYVIQGGNMVPAEFDGLEDQRVVVVCRPPSSNEYRHAGASRAVSQKVSELLVDNVKDIDVVNPREVDNWLDESDWSDFKELAKAVNADKVVYIELNDFELFKGKTLYQGHADVSVTVYDMKNNGKLVWDRHLGEILYPTNSGIPAQDKPEQQFEREFVNVVATRVAETFLQARREQRVCDRCAGESLGRSAARQTLRHSAGVLRGAVWPAGRAAAAAVAVLGHPLRFGDAGGHVRESLAPLPAERLRRVRAGRPSPRACPGARRRRAGDRPSQRPRPSPARC